MEQSKLKGKFITFEGPEGSGKSTQARLLCQYLTKKGYSVIYLREPGGTFIGKKIRKILLDPKNKEMSSITETLLYIASQAQIVEERIIPLLKKGNIVICDRFFDSTLAYQGYGGKIDIGFIRRLVSYFCKGIKPDLTFLLDIQTEEGLRRACFIKKDRMEEKPLSYHKRVRKGYLELAKLEPQRFKIIEVKEDKSSIQKKIRERVNKLLNC
jgi:dTMP kinase